MIGNHNGRHDVITHQRFNQKIPAYAGIFYFSRNFKK